MPYYGCFAIRATCCQNEDNLFESAIHCQSARILLESIDTSTVTGLRDRALICEIASKDGPGLEWGISLRYSGSRSYGLAAAS